LDSTGVAILPCDRLPRGGFHTLLHARAAAAGAVAAEGGKSGERRERGEERERRGERRERGEREERRTFKARDVAREEEVTKLSTWNFNSKFQMVQRFFPRGRREATSRAIIARA